MKEKEAMEIFEEILKRISQAVGDDITVISINGVRLAKEGEFPCAGCDKADPVEEPTKGDKVWAKPLRRLVVYTGATKFAGCGRCRRTIVNASTSRMISSAGSRRRNRM